MLVHADHTDPVEPGGIVGQQFLAVTQNRVSGGVPATQASSDPGGLNHGDQ